MKKTQFKQQPSAWDKMAADYEKLESSLKQLRDVLAVICLQQPDREIMVSWDDIKNIPKGTELEVSHAAGPGVGLYVFRVITPANESTAGAALERAGLSPDDHVPGGLGADA